MVTSSIKDQQTIAVWVIFAVTLFLHPMPVGGENRIASTKEPVKIDFNDVADESETIEKSTPPEVLRIAVAGMISPKYTYKYYVELLNLIGDKMNREVTFVQKKTYAEVNEMVKNKELDLAFVCSGPYVSGKEEFGMEIIAVPVCQGDTVYYSYFITSVNSGVKSLDELRGKIFAFTDPLSNTGYMVPVFYLAKRNETPETFFKRTFFTNSHDNSIQAVANGLADGAAVDSLIYEFVKSRNPELTEKTTVIEKSPPYGIPPVVVHPSLDPDVKEKLRRIFFSIHEDAKGKKILENLQIDRFVDGSDGDYQAVRELQRYLKSKEPGK